MASPSFESALRLASAAEVERTLRLARAPLVVEAVCSRAQPQPSLHLPGAVLVALEDIDVALEDAPGQPSRVSGNYSLRPAGELRAALEAAGISHTRPVVVYTQAIKLGGLDLAVACRLCWALALAGVQHVSLLAGGARAWVQAGFELTPEAGVPTPCDFFHDCAPQPFPLHPEYGAGTAEVENAVAALSAERRVVQLGDVRSWREFIGDAHDYPFPLPFGRIPGARWAHWGPSTYVGGDFFALDTGALHPLEQTAALWRDWGLDLGEGRIVFYCGSGWRSAVAWCLARLLGHTDCASYDGGFLEWSLLDARAAEHPIARGVPGQQPLASTSTMLDAPTALPAPTPSVCT